MAHDSGVIVAYLTAATAGTACDPAIGALLDRLAAAVVRRLGRTTLDDLRRDPRRGADPRPWVRVRRSIRRAASADPAFAGLLSRLQHDLDRRGARTIIEKAGTPCGTPITGWPLAAGSGAVGPARRHRSDPGATPTWARTSIMAGFALCVSGLGVFGYALFTQPAPPGPGYADFGPLSPGTMLAVALFVVGLVAATVGSIATNLSGDL